VASGLRELVAPAIDVDRAVTRAKRGVTYGLGLLGPAMRPAKRFVLVGTGRCGTELLVHFLQSHPDIVCDGEILSDRTIRFPAQYVDYRAMRARLAGARAYGFKLLMQQLHDGRTYLDWRSYFTSFAGEGGLIVLMARRNLLQVAVSYVSAGMRGVYHVRRGSKEASEAAPAVNLEPVALLVFVYRLHREVETAREALASLPHLSLVYEEDLEDPRRHQVTTDRVTDALGLDRVTASTDLTRIGSPRLRDRLENYEDVARLFRETPFAGFLEEDADSPVTSRG